MFADCQVSRFLSMDELPLKEHAVLKEFGKRFRAGFAKRHPISQRSLDTVKRAVREQCEEERDAIWKLSTKRRLQHRTMGLKDRSLNQACG